jgi:transposase
VIIEVEDAEREVLLRWKKRIDSFVLVRLKAEAVLYVSEGVPAEVVARMVERSKKTVEGWLRDWCARRLGSVVTGHAGNENAAKLTRAQKERVREALAVKPSESGIPVAFWDVPALEDLVSTRFGVEYESDSSFRLLMKFCGMSFKLPDSFDKRRDEEGIAKRMAEIRAQVKDLLEDGYEVFAADEVRVEHEAETRRMWLPVGVRTKLYVDREKAAQSYFGALNLRSGKVHLERIDGQQNTEQMIHVLARFQRAHPDAKLALVWDNASFHTSKDLTKLFKQGELFGNIKVIRMPPYAPDHNPVEHVWNQGKGAIANLQREAPMLTFSAFERFIKSGEFPYDFEHLPIPRPESDFV